MQRAKNPRFTALPHLHLEDNSFKRAVIVILALGVLVRIVLMPIAFHPDLFWVTYHAQNLALHGEITKDLAVQPIPLLLYSATIWVFQPVLSPPEVIWPDEWRPLDESDYQGAFDLALQIAQAPRIHLTLFLLKLPHLAFDLASAFLLLALLKRQFRGAIVALAFWMFNPIGLYISYLYGRYDVVAGFFVLLSLYMFQRVRPFSSLAALALAFLSRVTDALLAPFFLIGAFGQLKKQRRLPIGIAVFSAAALLTILSGALPQIISVLDRAHGQFLLAAKLRIILYDELVIFVIGYAILLFSGLEKDLSSYRVLRKYSLMVFLILFSFAFFNPQYFFALLPLLALELAEQPGLAWFHLVQIVGYAFYLLNWGSQTTWWLFLPLNPGLFSRLTSPELIIQTFTNYKAVIAIFRSLLTAASLWMAYRIYRTISPTPAKES
ncbi:MAG TPA: hypothetical protein VJ714_13135 [Anaerolineae bacterium]|nr:hypothetical protein [Anaerolineae bacterium]